MAINEFGLNSEVVTYEFVISILKLMLDFEGFTLRHD